MQFPINLILEIRTQEEYDLTHHLLESLKDPAATDLYKEDHLTLLRRIVTKLADSNIESRVLINGHPVALGTTEEMTKRYLTECGIDSKCNIVLEEWQDGHYKSIATRRFQKFP